MQRAALLICLIAELAIYGCSSSVRAPVDSRDKNQVADMKATVSQDGAPKSGQAPDGDYHIVVKGDTLYSIAWRYGFDYRDVARWNNISGNYVIYPGQFIRLKPPAKTAQPLKPGPIVSRRKRDEEKKTTTTRRPGQPPAETPVPGSAAAAFKNVDWQWPTRGKLIRLNTPTSRKGVDITGRAGQKVSAAAGGAVVYSGSGLLGYGKLIIIKHNENFLSAYAHNQKLLAREGDRVKQGQQIATMGVSSKGMPLLHFEIRKDGSPVDPLKHLPAKKS